MNWKNKISLVTGGAGFIGSHLVDCLLSLGSSVILLDSEETGRAERENLRIIKADVGESVKIDGNVDFIFHLAALAYPKWCNENPSLAFRTNVLGTYNMLELALEKGVQKFVFPSSAQLYGRYPKYFPIDEKHPTEYTNNFYNLTKKFGEDLCISFYERYGLPVIFFRLFNSFGPRQKKEYLIPTVIRQALEKKVIELWNEKPTRDFTFVEDTVKAFVRAAESTYCGGPINIGSGSETRVGDIARQIADALGAEIKFLNKEVVGSMRMCCDRTNAKKILGWEPETGFREGLNRTITLYKSSRKTPES
jgi:nucleoside-diphosphate-sugar epimerase